MRDVEVDASTRNVDANYVEVRIRESSNTITLFRVSKVEITLSETVKCCANPAIDVRLVMI